MGRGRTKESCRALTVSAPPLVLRMLRSVKRTRARMQVRARKNMVSFSHLRTRLEGGVADGGLVNIVYR